ncbi:MAG: hypothetical protein HY698_16445 [Deltaproteobacteria bacterium]|nr:hypothetical protein [Deltaproteobacteria bacterium]
MTPLFGVTIDSVYPTPDIVEALRRHSHRPTTRIVFDELVPATDYRQAAAAIHGVSYVLGEILDSFYVKQYSVQDYLARTTEYLGFLGDVVDIWEIGNEINGEWLGKTADVVAKMAGAYDLVKAGGYRTALTLYYNEDCWESPSNEMFTWAQANVPARMKAGLDYVLMSYYEDDCNGLQPNWQAVFDRLGEMFPSARIGFGECGTSSSSRKKEYIDRYYRMQINHPRFIGGYFWWYYKQDMVPYTNKLWSALEAAVASWPSTTWQ